MAGTYETLKMYKNALFYASAVSSYESPIFFLHEIWLFNYLNENMDTVLPRSTFLNTLSQLAN